MSVPHQFFSKKVTCPRCDGSGEEPGAPITLDEDGVALCGLCDGRRVVLPSTYDEYTTLCEETDQP